MRRFAPWILAGLLVWGCAPDAPEARRSRWVVVGIDGAEWSVIRALWREGRLPVLRRLAEGGTSARLATDYAMSPVIWTTVVTGARREDHGITGFVVPTERGSVPVSSAQRRLPALWNMLTTAGRSVAAVGWWASWPAEPVRGAVVSDRAERDRGVWPLELRARWEVWVAAAEAGSEFPGDGAVRDETTALAAEELAAERYDLLLAYFRSVDLVSHEKWKYWDGDGFPPVSAAEAAAGRAELVRAYEAVDAAIGRIVAAAGPEVDVLVLSDHGFRAQRPEKVRVMVDFDRVLEELGYLAAGGDGVDLAASELYTYGSARYERLKKVRCVRRGRQRESDLGETGCAGARERLSADLERVVYASGAPAFGVRDATEDERAAGADFTVVVGLREPSAEILFDGRPIVGAIGAISRLSGTHGLHTAGILVAAGPDVARDADLRGISIFDVTPTLLYGLGLPVAEDFAGGARLDLFREEVRLRRPLRTVPSWGVLGSVETVEAGEGDEEWIDELRGLGYLD